MTVTDDAQPAGLDDALLRDLVPRVLQRSTVELVTWHCIRLDYGGLNLASGGLYRVGGTAQDIGETVSWSLILKIVCSPASLDEETRSSPLAPRDDVGHWELLAVGVAGIPIRAPRHPGRGRSRPTVLRCDRAAGWDRLALAGGHHRSVCHSVAPGAVWTGCSSSRGVARHLSRWTPPA